MTRRLLDLLTTQIEEMFTGIEVKSNGCKYVYNIDKYYLHAVQELFGCVNVQLYVAAVEAILKTINYNKVTEM